MPPCECGCGQSVTRRFARGHNPKRSDGIPRSEVPREKVCEGCGRTYTRRSIVAQSNKHWLARRFCSQACGHASRADAQRGRILKQDATPQAGRKRARLLYPGPHFCDVCGEPAEIHHRDGNALNNARENIRFLCRKHHIGIEERNAYKRVEMTPERLERKRAQMRERGRRYRQRQKEQPQP